MAIAEHVNKTGQCWCGCGGATKEWFVPGHDSEAVWHVIRTKYGTTAQFLAHHGFGPDGKNIRAQLDALEKKS